MACKCADDIDTMLASRNTRLSRAIVFSGNREDNPNLMLVTEQVETGRGKKKAATMFLTFCPFCGVRYEAQSLATEER